MANSAYYYQLYEKYKKEAKDYEDNIEALDKIKSNLSDNFWDEQNAVNHELTQLSNDLEKAVRHDTTFDTNAADACDNKEKTSGQDANLDCALTALGNEIQDLKNKKIQAEADRDANWSKYIEETEKERLAQEALNNKKDNS